MNPKKNQPKNGSQKPKIFKLTNHSLKNMNPKNIEKPANME